MASIVNQAALDAVNKEWNAEITALFGDKPAGHYEKFCAVRPAKGTSVDHIVSHITSGLREWLGARQIGQLRAYRQNIRMRKYEQTLAIPAEQLDGDMTGTATQSVRDFLRAHQFYMDKIVIDSLVSNPTGYDGVAFLSNSHPNTGGTSNNVTTGAPTFSAVKTGIAALENMKDEAGEPLNIYPNLLLVGPAHREIAMQITGSDKPVGIGTTGSPVTSGANSSVLLPNYIGGSIAVAVSPRISGDKWYLFDTTKAAKPYYAYEFRSFREDILDKPTDENVFHRDEYLYGLSARVAPAPGAWQCAYGSTG